MDVKDLYPFVFLIIMTGMVVGVGLLVLANFSEEARTTTTIKDANVNLSSGTATLSQTFCVALTTIQNATAATTWDLTTYNASFTSDDTCAMAAAVPVDSLYNVTYTYGAANSAQGALDNFVTAAAPIASTWLPLIVTITSLAIVLGLIISSFGGRR